ncbi:hypothetical protein DB346_23675 [Verrucomicrobia bacterium LW23]|nr:hypothetical protein DB346_23675 [Verrucomicrobia bacterium LW23]
MPILLRTWQRLSAASRLTLPLILLLLAAPHAWAQKSVSKQEGEWREAYGGPLSTMQIPAVLRYVPNPPHGPLDKWDVVHESPDGAFRVHLNAFFRPVADKPPYPFLSPTDMRRLVLREEVAPRRPNVTFLRVGNAYVTFIVVDKKANRKTFTKYYTPNGQGKILTISYPWDRRAEFDPWLMRIERSWDFTGAWPNTWE